MTTYIAVSNLPVYMTDKPDVNQCAQCRYLDKAFIDDCIPKVFYCLRGHDLSLLDYCRDYLPKQSTS